MFTNVTVKCESRFSAPITPVVKIENIMLVANLLVGCCKHILLVANIYQLIERMSFNCSQFY